MGLLASHAAAAALRGSPLEMPSRNCTTGSTGWTRAARSASCRGAAEQVADRISRLSEAVSERGDGSGDACRQVLLTLLFRSPGGRTSGGGGRASSWTQIAVLSGLCRQFCRMDFRFLFHPQRKLLSIGFQVGENRRDDSCYDLLASEARLTSFLAVSHGQLPPEHWFALGRTMTLADGQPVLLSWSGSMFEYLMPALLMPSFPGTLLDASCGAAVRRHIRYARRHGVPWGISESCYNRTDEKQTYQYRAHGVPGLGLKRGLGEHLVVAPYASALAMMVAPREAVAQPGVAGASRAISVPMVSTTRSILRRHTPARRPSPCPAGPSWRITAG